MTPQQRKELEDLINKIADPEEREHYLQQLAMSDELDQEGILPDRLPLHRPGLESDEPQTRSRTYVFQWFREGERVACESLVVHTAGTDRALALFEQNAASGTLVHSETVTPHCEILSLDADDCRTCFGAGKVTVRGKQKVVACERCDGTGKRHR
jgi:hypothetical protein